MQLIKTIHHDKWVRLLKCALTVLVIFPAIIVIIHLSNYWDESHKDVPSIAITYSAMLTSAISTFVIALTLMIQQLQLNTANTTHRNSYDYMILNEIKYFFLSPEMTQTRKECWLLRSEWLGNREKFFDDRLKPAFLKQFKDNWGSYEEYVKYQETSEFKHFSELTKLLRWFEMISFYDFSETTGSALAFYYYWWREFLEAMCRDIETVKDEQLRKAGTVVAPSYINITERLDNKLSGFKNLVVNQHVPGKSRAA